ncbi:aminotransferase class IV [Ferruginivarius sediminum]|uniref:Probable branched-chain-amino-acid aminotransferase n=1 Tax=Ferruginivarius sediminum TaxID=2661937 RepID=A0A369T9J0_9PROT|nr:aminotransferase class IV [Ferruginivarius sediminum]RDD60837.1 2-keto-4-methylthiobutyrate aminotransferase [Ferruginivarius sediminum]
MRYYLNGSLHEEGTAAITPDDRGLTLGDGAFETIAVRGGQAMRLDWHLERLAHALSVLAFPARPGHEDLEAAVTAAVQGNALDAGVVRLTVTRGPGARGLRLPAETRPNVLATASEGLPPMHPIRLLVSQRVRRNEQSPLSGIKSISYLDNVLARIEAEAAGADEALLLNTQGRVAEAATANVFAVIGGAVVTPPVGEGCLPGIARRALMEPLAVEERRLQQDDLLAANEVFLTSSLGARSVSTIDSRPIGQKTEVAVAGKAQAILCETEAG